MTIAHSSELLVECLFYYHVNHVFQPSHSINVTPSVSVQFICLDVANGYSQFFVEFVAKVRGKFPEHTIMVSEST